MKEVVIQTEYIKLDQALKLSGAVSCGSDAKQWILEGMVKVNGEIEDRRGRKLKMDDVVSVEGDVSFVFRVVKE